MSTSLVNGFTIEEIAENIGISYIYQQKRGVINKCKGPQDYYIVKDIDIGFKADNSTFISLKYDAGRCFNMGNNFDLLEFSIGFKTFSELSLKYGEYEPRKFLKKYEKKLGKCYVWNFEKSDFEEIENKEFLEKVKMENSESSNDLNIMDMYDMIRQTIVAQDDQVKQILASIYKNQKIIDSSLDDETISKLKENVIIYGPTGTGKTEILKQIAKVCNVPIVIEDITSFVESGYVGRQVSEMITDLYSAAGMDLVFAERGILVIDEFDKIAERGINDGGLSTTGVQRSLLKLLDGGTISFKEEYDSESSSMDFNSSKLTVVALGAFSNIRKNDDYSNVSTNDFIDYGIMREVMGRFSKLVSMHEFSREDYRKILMESNLSPINNYQGLFDELGIKFSYDAELIDYIIDEAIALNCGARSLKTVFDGIISDFLFDIFAQGQKEIHLTIPKEKGKSYVAKKKASAKVIGFH